jgi:hypothetical protein
MINLTEKDGIILTSQGPYPEREGFTCMIFKVPETDPMTWAISDDIPEGQYLYLISEYLGTSCRWGNDKRPLGEVRMIVSSESDLVKMIHAKYEHWNVVSNSLPGVKIVDGQVYGASANRELNPFNLYDTDKEALADATAQIKLACEQAIEPAKKGNKTEFRAAVQEVESALRKHYPLGANDSASFYAAFGYLKALLVKDLDALDAEYYADLVQEWVG